MAEARSKKIQVQDFQQKYAPDFIAAQRDAGLLKDEISDEQALCFLENADQVMIALKENKLIGGFMLFCRSPDEVSWTDFFSIPGLHKGRLNMSIELWQRLCEFTVENDISWVVLTASDPKNKKLYEFGGFLPFAGTLMGLPAQFLHEIFKITNDKLFYTIKPLKSVIKDNSLQFTGMNSLVRIDLKSGLTQYALRKQPDEWHTYDRRCGKVYFLHRDDYSRHKVDNFLTDMVVLPEVGHVIFPQVDLTLRSPWWTKVPTEGLSVAAHDNDPCKVSKQGDHTHILEWDAYKASKVKPHRLTIEQNRDESCTCLFSNLSGNEYLRLALNFNEQTKYSGNAFRFGNLKFTFHPDRYEMKGYQSVDGFHTFRLYLYFKTKELKVTIERIDK